MKDHTKNILIILLFAFAVGAVCFGVGYAIGTLKTIESVGDIAIKYLDYKNITIPNISKHDLLKFANLIKLGWHGNIGLE